MRHGCFVLAGIIGAVLIPVAAPAAGVSYKITKSVPLGAPDGWDYLYFEPQSHRVYVAHSTEITVVDGRSGDLVGRVTGIAGVNGVTAIPQLRKGYTDSRGSKAAVAFTLDTLKVTREIAADTDTDALIYEPATRRIFVMNGDGMDTTVIDATDDKPVATIALQGKPEFAVADAQGHVFVNITDKREIVKIDARTATIQARWPIPSCEGPHGLAMDRDSRRLFSSCVNSLLVVVDADSGHLIASLPIGRGTDAAAFDPKRKLVFSSNGEGTLSIIREQSPDQYVSLGQIPTKPFARTMTLDPDSGRLYLVTADVDEVNPKAERLRDRYAIRPGTVQLLFLDPS
jgi:DNA-binding beta-propeller fold protein YncE